MQSETSDLNAGIVHNNVSANDCPLDINLTNTCTLQPTGISSSSSSSSSQYCYCTLYSKAMGALHSALVKIQLSNIERRTKIMSFETIAAAQCGAHTTRRLPGLENNQQ